MRQSRTVTPSGGTATTTTFVWDEDNVLQEYDSDGTISYYTEHPGVTGGIVSRRASGSTSEFYAYDPANHTRHILDSDGNVIVSWLYDAFGNQVSGPMYGSLYSPSQQFGMEPGFGGLDAQIFGQLQLFGRQHGYHSDAAANAKDNNRLFVRARHYDTFAGRWMSRDPLGDVDGPTLYTYCGNDGVNLIDPRGCAGVAPADSRSLKYRPYVVSSPSLLISLIPVWGSGQEALHDFDTHQYFWGAVNTALAFSDLFILPAIWEDVVKVGIKVEWNLVKMSGSHTWEATKAWMVEKGYSEYAYQPFHHWFFAKGEGVGKFVWRWMVNQPWNILRLREELVRNMAVRFGGPAELTAAELRAWAGYLHSGIHGNKGVIQLKLAERLWYGTPDLVKPIVASSVGHATELLEIPSWPHVRRSSTKVNRYRLSFLPHD